MNRAEHGHPPRKYETKIRFNTKVTDGTYTTVIPEKSQFEHVKT